MNHRVPHANISNSLNHIPLNLKPPQNSMRYFQYRDGWRSHRLPVHRAAAVLGTYVCNVKASGKLTMSELLSR
jgi:hypothetical protein